MKRVLIALMLMICILIIVCILINNYDFNNAIKGVHLEVDNKVEDVQDVDEIVNIDKEKTELESIEEQEIEENKEIEKNVEIEENAKFESVNESVVEYNKDIKPVSNITIDFGDYYEEVDNEDEIEWRTTLDSDLFKKIGYDRDNRYLYLVFRRDNSYYRYTRFSSMDWSDFRLSNLKESYYLERIKGKYRCEKRDMDGEYYHTAFEEDYNYIIGYTSQGTPIIDEPEAEIDWRYCFSSDCFSQIGYDDENENLYVVFKETDEEYRYLSVPFYVWYDLLFEDSKGEYYNKNIKGFYSCEKIDNLAQYSPNRLRMRYQQNGYYSEETQRILDEYEEYYNKRTEEYNKQIEEIMKKY